MYFIDSKNDRPDSTADFHAVSKIDQSRTELLSVFNKRADVLAAVEASVEGLIDEVDSGSDNISDQTSDDVKSIDFDPAIVFALLEKAFFSLIALFGLYLAIILISHTIEKASKAQFKKPRPDYSKLYINPEGDVNFDQYLLYRGKALDQYSYNKWTTNKSYFPAITARNSGLLGFKPFSRYSANWLPPRVGTVQKENVGTFFRKYTVFKATPEEIDLIKQILIKSYLRSYSIELSEDDIQVIPDGNDRIKAIKYTGTETSVTVRRATSRKINRAQERVAIKNWKWKDSRIVDRHNNLLIPPSIDNSEGLWVPFEYIYNSNESKLKEKFGSLAGKRISPLEIEITKNFLDQVDKDEKQLQTKFSRSLRTFPSDVRWFGQHPVFRKMYFQDQVTTMIADQFRGQFNNKKHLMKAVLRYVNKHRYIPDPKWEVSRHTFDFIISGGGDCDDRALMIHNLAMNLNISCGIFLYKVVKNRGGHAIAACEFDSKWVKGFDIDKNGQVDFVRGGRYKPMDYDRAGKLSHSIDFDKPYVLALINKQGKVHLFK